MSDYQHILVALDLGETQAAVLQRALSLAIDSTRISLVHVVDMIIYPDAYMGNLPLEVLEQTIEHAKKALQEIGEQHAIAPERQFVEQGRAATKIHDIARANDADLIVVGSHGRHGVQLLLGSTANAVLHGAQCDVLAIRV
ncbi:MAG: universal stress protein [Pseudomonadales bacterium]